MKPLCRENFAVARKQPRVRAGPGMILPSSFRQCAGHFKRLHVRKNKGVKKNVATNE